MQTLLRQCQCTYMYMPVANVMTLFCSHGLTLLTAAWRVSQCSRLKYYATQSSPRICYSLCFLITGLIPGWLPGAGGGALNYFKGLLSSPRQQQQQQQQQQLAWPPPSILPHAAASKLSKCVYSTMRSSEIYRLSNAS